MINGNKVKAVVLRSMLINGEHCKEGDTVELLINTTDYHYLINTKAIEVVKNIEMIEKEVVAGFNKETLTGKKLKNKGL